MLRPRILAIDDTPANLVALGVALASEYQLLIATSGAMGLSMAAASPPDLILLDVMMPEMSGYETCRRLKAEPRLGTIPVIFVTALDDDEAELASLEQGAADFVTKPINVGVTKLRIRNLLERERLRKQVEAQRDQLQQAAETGRQARQREVEIGTRIQHSLKGEMPEAIEGAWLAAYAEPSQVIDGDFYAVRRYHPACFEVLVGDVMGKGVPAALLGAGIKTTYNQVLADLLVAGLDARALPSPEQIVNALHRALTPQLIELASFATLALYRFDLEEGTLTYVNAGHTPGLLTRALDARVITLMGDNLPIGVVPEEVYVQTRLSVGPGDALLVFSDGLTEARNAQGEEFGMERLCGLFEAGSVADLPPATVLHAVRGELRRFTGGVPTQDDTTAFMVELHQRRRPSPRRIEQRVQPFVFMLPWSLDALATLRRQIEESARVLPEADASALLLASFEAATNILRHAPLMVGDATLACRITSEDQALVVELIYPSEAFTPPANVQPDLSGESESGFGLYIIEQSVDSVAYGSPMPGIASIRLVKRASPRAQAPASPDIPGE